MLLGTIARHLPPADPKRAAALDMLLGVLGTPSEAVQRSVSSCLPPLVAPLATDTEYTQVGVGACDCVVTGACVLAGASATCRSW